MTKVKVEVIQPFERYKVGDKPELTPAKAASLEKIGLVKAANQTAERQMAKVEKPTA